MLNNFNSHMRKPKMKKIKVIRAEYILTLPIFVIASKTE